MFVNDVNWMPFLLLNSKSVELESFTPKQLKKLILY